MATQLTNLYLDAGVRDEATRIFAGLGLDLSGAVNVFLRQCVQSGGFPFEFQHNKAREAMEEARRISRDPTVPSYNDMESLKAALDSDD